MVNLINREVHITELPTETKAELRRFYYEMPDAVRMDIALNFRDIFPEVTPRMFVHMNRADVESIIKESSELLKIFEEEFKAARFSFPMDWFDRLKLTVFEGSWNTNSLMNGLNLITMLYFQQIGNVNHDQKALKFMVNYLKAWLNQKELGMEFFRKTFCTDEYRRLAGSPVSLREIVDAYLSSDATNTTIKTRLEALFYSILQVNPPQNEENNIFSILDVAHAVGIVPVQKYESAAVFECTDVSTMTESEIADNVGQVAIFGTHDFGTMPVEQIKEDVIRLNRNTIAEYFGGNPADTHISFDIPEQVKMILREELSPNMCAVTVKRGNEVDMVTLLTHESKTYLLFRKIGNDDVTFGITLGSIENGVRELISISNESDFTYTLVGGEEIGVNS